MESGHSGRCFGGIAIGEVIPRRPGSNFNCSTTHPSSWRQLRTAKHAIAFRRVGLGHTIACTVQDPGGERSATHGRPTRELDSLDSD